ncbi:MAG: HTTM domain-containing protein [Flavobacteriales bacterium]|nr:HTTM domain-containing protein [Flavobacteriales bacterium]MDG1780198.1 HTTM domain-containing protein [Flavobacteriales bacterium]MDG2247430.1 HTTM domain-containing protein [Flavobacteriales bacterium]
MSLLHKFIAKMSAEVNAPATARLFRIAAYSWMLLNALYFFTIRDMLWGPYSIGMSAHPDQSVGINIAYVLDHVREYAVPAYFAYMAALVCCLVGWFKWIPKVVVFVVGWMLYYAFIPAFNSSYLLYQVFAFFLIGVDEKATSTFSIVLTNVGMLACRIQFLMVYALAGMFKLLGRTWLEGSSVYYALHLDHFTWPWLRDLLVSQKWLMLISNYFGLIYQLAFPLLIWFKKARVPLFIAGIAFHGFIGAAMRLPEFGLAMIFGYTLFFDEALSQKVLRKVRLARTAP